MAVVRPYFAVMGLAFALIALWAVIIMANNFEASQFFLW
jgi:hypothetical protein